MDHLLNNFLGRFFRKALTIFGARVKNGLFINKKKKGVSINIETWERLSSLEFCVDDIVIG